MATKWFPKGLSVENLESRLNLSTAAASMPSLQAIWQSLPASVEQASLYRNRPLAPWVNQTAQVDTSQQNLIAARHRITLTAPAAPTDLAAQSASTHSVTLGWTDNATNESGYYVYRSTDGTHFSRIATLAVDANSYTDNTVSPATVYTYKVAAWNGAGRRVSSPIAVTTAALPAPDPTPAPAPTPAPSPTLPDAATNLAASSSTSSTASLTWTDNATDETGYHVYRSTDGANFTQVASLDANTTTYNDSGLSASTQYWYKVDPWNGAGETAGTAVSVITQAPAPTLPTAATNLAATSPSPTTTNLTWTDNATNESGYRVYRSTDGTNFSQIASLGANTTAYSDSGLSASTQYWYKVDPWNGAGETTDPAVSVTTQAPAPTLPDAATNLAAIATSPTTANVTWTDNATNESGYRVYRSTDDTNFSQIASLGANTTAYSDSGLSASTQYWYKVDPWNIAGETAGTAVSVTTAVSAPTAATNLAATSSSPTTANVTWTDNATNESGYRVYRSTDGTTFTQIASLGASTTAYSDSGLSASTKYWYKVNAWNATAETPSVAVSVTTQVAAPAAATNVAATATSATTISVTWTDNATNESGYRIYRSTDGTNFTQIASVAANTTAYADSGLTAGTQYWYKANAWNATAETASAAVSVTTQPAPISNPVTITTRSMTSFTELVIDGTSGNDTIALSQSGTTFTIAANGQTQTITGSFGDIVVKGEAGDNSITVDSTVNIATLLYGGTGNATLVDHGTNFNTLVTIGGGNCTLTGNGINTNYWADTGDTINATSTETAAGDVHRVASFVTPAEPTDTTGAYKVTKSSLWGTGPTFYDVNQRQIGDCYYLSTIQSLAISEPAKLRTLAVDLGDGTYGVQFDRNGTLTYVRVDNTFSSQASVVGASGNDWAVVMEKAYAYFRSGANTYASLNSGNSGSVMGDFGLSHNSVSSSASASTLYNLISNELAAGKAVTASTDTSATALVGSHCYSVYAVSTDSSGAMWVTVRNPWGFDGTGSDSNPNDGLVTISMAVFQANVSWLDYQV